jgi:RHS repeat-associated protein
LRGGTELEAQSYRWRRDDTLAEIVDRKRGRAHFGHDDRGRLMVARYPDGAVQCLVPDAAGNVFRRPDHSDRVYGPGGELREADGTKYAHDEDGQLVEKIEPSGKRWKYAWDGAGNLAEVTRPDETKVVFAYDALGRRVRKSHGERVTTWLWDGHVPLHEQTTDAAPVTWIFEPESFAPLAKIEGDRRYGIVTDHLGTPTSLHDEAGRIAWQMQLDLYGVPQKPPQETRPYGVKVQTDVVHTSCPWRLPGQYADEETGLYYNRFRYYDPKAGRYVSPDPIGLDGGLNPFAYVQDPSAWIDPFGLAACGKRAKPRTTLPPLHGTELGAFSRNKVREVTLKPRDRLFRSPFGDLPTPRKPRGWFGTRRSVTKAGTESLSNIQKWGNPLQVIREYEVTREVTVYYGKVAGGRGYQVMFPKGVDAGKCLSLVGESPLR